MHQKTIRRLRHLSCHRNDSNLHANTVVARQKLCPPVGPSQSCFNVPWILGRPCDSWFWDVPKIQTLAAQTHGLCPVGICIFGSPCSRKRTLLPVENVYSSDLHRIARMCAGTGGRCSVSGLKHLHPKASASRSELCSSRDHHALSVDTSRLPWFSPSPHEDSREHIL